MEWATGLSVQNGELMAEFAASSGRKKVADLPSLAIRGLPSSATHRRKVCTDFSTWKSVSGISYLNAFTRRHQGTQNHQFFQFSDGGVDFVVPALALMRAFFRPTKFVLPEMFLPQGIEHICIPGNNSAHCELAPSQSWAVKRRTKKRASGFLPLSWLFSFPSARAMCESLHSHAIAGRLGMSLPTAKVQAVVRGRKLKNSFYVTELRLISLDALESPFDFAAMHCTTIPFYSVKNLCRDGKRLEPLRDSTMRHRPNGEFAVSDQEWKLIEPLLTPKLNKHRTHNARLQFDGVVEKVGTGVPWRKMRYLTGTWETASSALQRWKKSGVWPQVRSVLAQRPA